MLRALPLRVVVLAVWAFELRAFGLLAGGVDHLHAHDAHERGQWVQVGAHAAHAREGSGGRRLVPDWYSASGGLCALNDESPPICRAFVSRPLFTMLVKRHADAHLRDDARRAGQLRPLRGARRLQGRRGRLRRRRLAAPAGLAARRAAGARGLAANAAGAAFEVRRELELYGVTCHQSGFLQRRRDA